jgi:hypothetical protein
MEALTEKEKVIILKKKIKSTVLISQWLNEYPYKRYPKHKFERRYARLLEIDEKLNKIIEPIYPEL